MNKIYQNSHPAGKKAGFTLIELLVVVLIIGILAAVALPQYEKAVMKSRAINGIQIAETVVKASEVYYMANGQYTPRFNDLDISFPQCTITGGGSLMSCSGYLILDLLAPDTSPSTLGNVFIHYCPGATSSLEACNAQSDFTYSINFNVHPSAPNQHNCTGITEKGIALCKTLKF